MDNKLIQEYTALKAAKDDITAKRAAAQARLEDAEGALAEHVAEVKALGYQSVAELQLAISEAESEITVLIEQGQAQLQAGGYA